MSDDSGMQQDQGQHQASQSHRDHFLNFFKQLQSVSNKIHSTGNLDEVMLDLSKEICDLFGCERLTMYAVSSSRNSIYSKLKTGLHSFKDFKLPISEASIAGYVALHKKLVNLHDVYDEAELASYSPQMRFMRKVDDRTGFRTKTMLTNPIVDARTGDLLGVIQLLNNLEDEPFSVIVEEGLKELCLTLAIAFSQRMKGPQSIPTRYDHLVSAGTLSATEMELATRAARRKHADLEEVLINDFKIKLADIGASLAEFFGVPYEPYRALRDKPVELLKNFKREYVENNEWLLLEQGADGLLVLATDPDRVEGSRIVHNLFPKTEIAFCVTSNVEFAQTVDQFFGVAPDRGVAARSRDTTESDHATEIEDALLQRVEKVLSDAFQQKSSDISLTVGKGTEKSKSSLRESGALESLSGRFVIDYRIAFA
ncbi:hypothetical protein BH11PSE11_BH11PSE11_23060 [soil metagenome]